MLSAVATSFILLGIFIMYGVAGGVRFNEISQAIVNSPNSQIVLLSLSLLLIGFAIKSGLVPFHAWVPDAYSEAPNPISVYLAGIITKVAGVYVLIRIVFNVFGITFQLSQILMYLGIVSAGIGALAAILQDDSKRMLAYSSVSQVGYIILGISTGIPLGIIGGVFHLFNHAILKSLLFINASEIEKATGIRDISKMSGLATKLRVTGATFAIGSLSVAGIPPLNGFWSKLFILIALFQSRNYIIAFIALLISVVTLAYFLLFHKKALFGKVNEKFISVKEEVSFSSYFPVILLSAIAILAGIFFPFVIDLLIKPAADVLIKGVFL
jgi:multicomponent Na+:H+ antiporter subunit D